MLNLLGKEGKQIREGKQRRDAANQISINVQDILHRIQLHSVKANLQRVKITQEQFVQLCRRVKKDALSQPGLLKIDGPIFVSTGTLGSYQQLSTIIDRCGHPKFMNYLFLGDYAGKYDQSVECLVALFAYKLFAPYNFFLLRGCHETLSLARSTYLQDHLSQYFGSSKPFIEVCQTFCSLPYAAIIDEKVFCVHGGISPYLQSLEQINQIPRPLDASDKQLACDLLWADPTNLYKGWTENDRGIGVSFGTDVVSSFVKSHDLSLVCRGHEVPFEGFKFFSEKRMVTICSLSKYCDILNNSSAVMMIDESGNVLFKAISQRTNYTGVEQEQAMTFIDLIKRKQERALKQEQEEERARQKEEQNLEQIEEKKTKHKKKHKR